jgi:hypothetical protein
VKSESEDLTPLLRRWAYEQEAAVRRLKALDGRDILQVRLPLGVEQYEIDGRPDGLRPQDVESWLEYYGAQARALGREFTLCDGDVEKLYEEGLLYYHRYLLFFQMEEYALCARDTRRNLKLLGFVSRHATPKQAEVLEQYRPYILRMNVMARALLRLQGEKDLRGALRLLEAGIRAVEALPPIEDNQVFAFEKVRSLRSLADLHSQLAKQVPVPERTMLAKRLADAVRREDYEEAAHLRDRIRNLGDGG